MSYLIYCFYSGILINFLNAMALHDLTNDDSPQLPFLWLVNCYDFSGNIAEWFCVSFYTVVNSEFRPRTKTRNPCLTLLFNPQLKGKQNWYFSLAISSRVNAEDSIGIWTPLAYSTFSSNFAFCITRYN